MIDFSELTKGEVRLIQQGLAEEGFPPGPIDGIAGRLTRSAYGEFLHDEAGVTPVSKMEFDERTERVLASLNPKVAKRARKPLKKAQEMIMDKLAVEYKLISGNRTCAQQNALYAKGRTKPGPKVTNARCGFSNHNFGLALDGGVFRDGEYLDNHEPKTASKAHRIAGQIFKNHGFE